MRGEAKHLGLRRQRCMAQSCVYLTSRHRPHKAQSSGQLKLKTQGTQGEPLVMGAPRASWLTGKG